MDLDAPEPVIPERKILSVSQLNRSARLTIEQRFNAVWVTGELSNFARPRSGHWYFTLKDKDAQVRCAMFANANRRVQIQPTDGQLVLISGRVSLYEGRGDFQIIVDHMEAAGEGALRQAFEALKLRLNQEGLFANERKRALPAIPSHVAVITSATGAALRDVLSVWQRRFPSLQVTLVPSAVQGQEAEIQLLDALRQADQLDCDIILLTRGGGSLEDLWVFNLESIARAIAASNTPIVSAIGHEIDIAITDFVADLRAPTPSAAAELIAPDINELRQNLASELQYLRTLFTNGLRERGLQLRSLAVQLVSPEQYCQQAAQTLDELSTRLLREMRGHLSTRNRSIELSNKALANNSPRRQLEALQASLMEKQKQLVMQSNQALQARQQQLANAARLLESVSPLPTLNRGYALIRDSEEKLITDVGSLTAGEQIKVQLRDGQALGQVTKILPDETLSKH